jgi:tetrahydromethanopterin S-methyltransferase subunit C
LGHLEAIVQSAPTTPKEHRMSIAATTSTTSRQDAAPRLARWALVLALLGIPGVTLAWDLPAGGFWIGMPLAVAAVVLGARALREGNGGGRGVAIGALVLAAAEIVLTVGWTLAS